MLFLNPEILTYVLQKKYINTYINNNIAVNQVNGILNKKKLMIVKTKTVLTFFWTFFDEEVLFLNMYYVIFES